MKQLTVKTAAVTSPQQPKVLSAYEDWQLDNYGNILIVDAAASHEQECDNCIEEINRLAGWIEQL